MNQIDTSSLFSETELPNRKVTVDTLKVICHRYYWASKFTLNKKVLEVGCGSGLGLDYLASNTDILYGSDIVYKNLCVSRHVSNIPLICLDAHKLPFADSSFDVVIALASIIYMDVPLFLEECKRILTRKGVLLLNTPNKDIPYFRPSNASYKYYSIPELAKMLRKNDFDSEIFGAFPVTVHTSYHKIAMQKIKHYIYGYTFLKKMYNTRIYKELKRITKTENNIFLLTSALVNQEIDNAKSITLHKMDHSVSNDKYRIIYLASNLTN